MSYIKLKVYDINRPNGVREPLIEKEIAADDAARITSLDFDYHAADNGESGIRHIDMREYKVTDLYVSTYLVSVYVEARQ